jgi:hypothetical protein
MIKSKLSLLEFHQAWTVTAMQGNIMNHQHCKTWRGKHKSDLFEDSFVDQNQNPVELDKWGKPVKEKGTTKAKPGGKGKQALSEEMVDSGSEDGDEEKQKEKEGEEEREEGEERGPGDQGEAEEGDNDVVEEGDERAKGGQGQGESNVMEGQDQDFGQDGQEEMGEQPHTVSWYWLVFWFIFLTMIPLYLFTAPKSIPK